MQVRLRMEKPSRLWKVQKYWERGGLDSGSASVTPSTLPVGVNAIKGLCGGDFKFTANPSKTVKQVLNCATTTWRSSQNPSGPGQSVTFIASLAPQFHRKIELLRQSA